MVDLVVGGSADGGGLSLGLREREQGKDVHSFALNGVDDVVVVVNQVDLGKKDEQ
jgi:hypothetical protein